MSNTEEGQVAPSYYDQPRRTPLHPRGKFSRQSRTTVVRFGYMTAEEADAVFLASLREWGLTTSSAEQREELLYAIAEAMVMSTSKDEENLDTKFLFDDEYYELRILHQKASELSPGRNDSYLRVWTRSFNRAQIPCMMTDMLSNSTNVELRQAVARRAECTVEQSPFAIDVFDAVIDHSGRNIGAAEISMYNKLKAVRTSKAHERAQEVGMLTARNDTSSRETPMRSGGAPKTDPVVRTGFAPVASGMR